MNQTTEQTPETQKEFSSRFIAWLIILTGATLLLVFVMERSRVAPSTMLGEEAIFPWISAGGHSIQNGLNMFSGRTPDLASLGTRVWNLIGFLVVFIIAPTLYFLGWRSLALAKASGEPTTHWTIPRVLFIIGGILTILPSIPIVPAAFIQRSVSESLRSAQATESSRDQVVNELDVVAWKAYQYRVLPASLGGGGGSFRGFVVPQELAKTPDATYTVTATDSIATLRGVSALYPNTSATVDVGAKGHMQNWRYTGEFE